MSLSINHNLMAREASENLGGHYRSLAVSTRRLSTGLRVNSAADDAAGLAVRELMRADIAAAWQGVRNANDAISLIQVADGALAIIDEKLIRMKELAEQAATGTYNSIQRQMIDSEFQAMGSEIDRIARATDFNGMKLLDGSLKGTHDGSQVEARGRMKIHFGAMNDSAEDYYYLEIGGSGTGSLGLRDILEGGETFRPGVPEWITEMASIDLERKKIFYNIPSRLAGLQDGSPAGIQGMVGIDFYQLPVGLENVEIVSDATAGQFVHKPHVCIFTTDGQQLTGINPDKQYIGTPASVQPPWPEMTMSSNGNVWWDGKSSDEVISILIQTGLLDEGAKYQDRIVAEKGGQVTGGGSTLTMEIESEHFYLRGQEKITIDRVTEDLVFLIGGHASRTSGCNQYSLTINADLGDEFFEKYMGGLQDGEEGVLMNIATQERAQAALVRLDQAMVEKDKIRAHLGAMQNRLENTITSMTIQGENLQSAESRVSDTDVAIEMTAFVRSQVLTQSALAMLVQANSEPRVLLGLIGG